jgi:hypothetical protein
VDALTLLQIEHLDGVIAERAHEQSFASWIEREMVDASFDTRQWDRLFEFERRGLGIACRHCVATKQRDPANCLRAEP